MENLKNEKNGEIEFDAFCGHVAENTELEAVTVTKVIEKFVEIFSDEFNL